MRIHLKSIYNTLFKKLGPQHWWPADTPFEVMVGAILTQNTNWQNVTRAIENLKKENLLSLKSLKVVPKNKLARLIRPTGYFNIKTDRLKRFVDFLFKECAGNLKKISKIDTLTLRKKLLAVKGIGPETADSILLYALGRPIFVVDAYTKRIFFRHRLIKPNWRYEEIQNFFMQNLKKDVKLFNEYHALLVKVGKEFCLRRKPRCDICPLKRFFLKRRL